MSVYVRVCMYMCAYVYVYVCVRERVYVYKGYRAVAVYTSPKSNKQTKIEIYGHLLILVEHYTTKTNIIRNYLQPNSTALKL